MTQLTPALSLTNSVTQVGAIAGFVALLGIALLSLLAFSQAREIKRLREWAGRAPERASELEQRVSAEAAARIQRPGQPAAPPGARVVPRKTPLVSAPVSTAVNATVAAGKIGAPANPAAGPTSPTPASIPEALPAAGAGAQPAPVAQALRTQASSAQVPPGQASPLPGQTSPPPDQGSPAQALPGQGSPLAAQASPAQVSPGQAVSPSGQDLAAGPAATAAGAAAADAASPRGNPATGAKAEQPLSPQPAADRAPSLAAGAHTGGGQDTPAPATVAARAAGAAVRAPLPPSPSAPSPPGPPSPSAVAPSATASGLTAAKPPAGPPSPAMAARAGASRAVGAPPGEGVPPRAPAPARSRVDVPATSAGARVSERVPGGPGASGPKYFKPERSPRRATALVVGGVIVGVLAIVLAVSLLKSGGGAKLAAQSSSTPSQRLHRGSQKTPNAVASHPSETAVVVLNGTGTPDLAHHLASDLRQSGYNLAGASAGVPPGTHATTVIEYTTGHRADAKAVAKTLNVTKVQAIESTIASLAPSATVVVLAGADQASQLGGGGAQSGGEPAAVTGGEGTPAGQ